MSWPIHTRCGSHAAAAEPPAGEPGSRRWRRWTVLLLLVGAVAGGLAGLSAAARRWTSVDDILPTAVADRGDVDVRVVAKGELESRANVEIRCLVPNLPGDGISGTTIIWMAPNGSQVKKGDLIVEFDATYHKERLYDQELETDQARANQLQATARYENQKTKNETALANAILDVQLAELALKSFEDAEGGTFQLALQDVELQIQLAESLRLMKSTELEGVEELVAQGYKSRGDLARARLEALSAERSLAAAETKRTKSLKYDYQEQKLRLEGALASAKRRLALVRRNNESLLAQARAAKLAADAVLAKELERLEECRANVEECRLYAPQDGMIVHARGIDVGDEVHERRLLMVMPELTRMQVKAKVHETDLNKLRSGMAATVRLDARPGEAYRGSVQSLSVMPESSWLDTGARVYEVVVTVDEPMRDVRPGMTAVVEIDVAHARDAVRIPVTAVMRLDGDDWCYVDTPQGLEQRRLKLGAANETYAAILSGLDAGERVVLDPWAVLGESFGGPRTLSSEGGLRPGIF